MRPAATSATWIALEGGEGRAGGVGVGDSEGDGDWVLGVGCWWRCGPPQDLRQRLRRDLLWREEEAALYTGLPLPHPSPHSGSPSGPPTPTPPDLQRRGLLLRRGGKGGWRKARATLRGRATQHRATLQYTELRLPHRPPNPGLRQNRPRHPRPMLQGAGWIKSERRQQSRRQP